MKDFVSAFVVGLFAFGLFVLLTTVRGSNSFQYAESILPIATRAIGLYMASISLLALLVLALKRASGEVMGGFSLPLVGGLYLVAPHWSLAMILALVTIVYFANHIIASRFGKT